MSSQVKKKAEPSAGKIDLIFSLHLSSKVKFVIIAALLFLSALLAFYYIYYAYSVNKENSFPLDDPWIHLTFAKNLAEYGSYSYYKNEVVTAGSTSPIYTLILAAGFLITKNEMILSYILGIGFLVLSVLGIYKLSELSFPKEYWLAVVCTIIFIFDGWMNFIADSGMETSMFIFLLILNIYFYRKRKVTLFAISLGLLFWVRPDAIAFITALLFDYFIFLIYKRKNPRANSSVREFSKAELIKTGIIFGLIMLVYFAVNLKLSGTLLPNTYNAKLAYYSPQFRSRTDFLEFEVWEYFTRSYYVLLIIPFCIGAILIIYDFIKKRYNDFFLPLIFCFALIFIYWYKLPYAHVFGRYMMPVIPFYILIFMYGSRQFFCILNKFTEQKYFANGLNFILYGSVIIFSITAYAKTKVLYQEQTRHIYIRQVVTAKWLKENTPESSIVATHDVGAIAFYSGRKVVDVVGLINPEFINRVNKEGFNVFIEEELSKLNVSYVAFLREWFRVVNQNPLFTAGDQGVEIMDVFKFYPYNTHILSQYINGMSMYGLDLVKQRQFREGLSVLNRAFSLDTTSSLNAYCLGYAYFLSGDNVSSEKYLKKALQLFPEYKDAVFSIAKLYKKEKKINDAKKEVLKYMELNPSDTAAVKVLDYITDTTGTK